MALSLLSEMGVDSEMDTGDAPSSRVDKEPGTIVLDGSQVAAMRHLMHELSNILTGVMISGGLLAQYLEGNGLRRYAAGVCEGCERGGALLRELRSQLLAACGEAGGGTFESSSGGQEPKVESF